MKTPKTEKATSEDVQKYCGNCGQKKEPKIYSDANSELICRNVICYKK